MLNIQISLGEELNREMLKESSLSKVKELIINNLDNLEVLNVEDNNDIFYRLQKGDVVTTLEDLYNGKEEYKFLMKEKNMERFLEYLSKAFSIDYQEELYHYIDIFYHNNEEYGIIENNLIEKTFEDKYEIIEKEQEFHLIRKEPVNSERPFIREVISVFENEEGAVFISVAHVKSIIDQEEEVIDYILEYLVSREKVEELKNKIRENIKELSYDNYSMFVELTSHEEHDFLISEKLDHIEEFYDWMNSEVIVKTIESLIRE